MSSGGGKGGGQTTQQKIPDWIRYPSQRNLKRAEDVQKLGYMAYEGPDLAAFTPAQEAAAQNTFNAAAAYGLQAPSSLTEGLPQAQDYNGISGYSSFPIFEQAKADFAQRNPEQQKKYDRLFS